MNGSFPPALRPLLADSRRKLLTEGEFLEAMRKVLDHLEKHGLRVSVKVLTGDNLVAQYGDLQGAPQTKSETLTSIAPLQCQMVGGPSKGTALQHEEEAAEVWHEVIAFLKAVVEEHWRARRTPAGLWAGQDPSVASKLEWTVVDSVTLGHSLAYVRLDCDGFGAVKERLGGEALPTQVMGKISTFLRQYLERFSLVFHPHGDEFKVLIVNLTPRDVMQRLLEFQREFEAQDFRPNGYQEPVKLGIRMVVSFSAGDQAPVATNAVLEQMRAEAEAVDIKNHAERGFIEIAQVVPPADGILSKQAMEEAVLSAYRGLSLENVEILGDDLHDLIAGYLVRHDEANSTLTTQLRQLADKFALKTFAHGIVPAWNIPERHVATRFIHTARLAALMLHVVLKRCFLADC
jgi:GGDEF domain-containing protein